MMNVPSLQALFYQLLDRYKATLFQKESFWDQLAKAYDHPLRHYHTFDHLTHLYLELSAHLGIIENWDAILFAIFYHDAVYDVRSNLNEEHSADSAEKVLRSLNATASVIDLVRMHILATKLHTTSPSFDTGIFIDADLSILGADDRRYDLYATQIRNEYIDYPDSGYRAGRRKVLQEFLGRKRIFITDVFYQQYESKARQNLRRELEALS